MSANPGETLPTETVVMYRPADVSATIVGADGKPIADQAVNLVAVYGNNGKIHTTVHTDVYGVAGILSVLPATNVTMHFFVEAKPDSDMPELTSTEETYSLSADTSNDLGQAILTPVNK